MHLKTRFHGQMSDTFHAAVFVTLSGGFQDAYTYICRGQVFANAQTGNIVLLSAALLRGDWAVCLRYAIPLLSFVFGTMAADIRAIWVCCGLLRAAAGELRADVRARRARELSFLSKKSRNVHKTFLDFSFFLLII